jgi:hypothetical protein
LSPLVAMAKLQRTNLLLLLLLLLLIYLLN